MKFHATIVLEFTAHDIGDAGRRLNELLGVGADGAGATSAFEKTLARPRRESRVSRPIENRAGSAEVGHVGRFVADGGS
jgi:hypothetical protein